MKLLRVVLLLLFACIFQAQAKVYLVGVGIADYPGKANDLRISDNDAKTIVKVFEATKDAYATTITNEGATIGAVLRAMQNVFSSAKADDTIILYFSGHGTPGALACYDGPLSYQRIFNVMKTCKASKKIIMADACYSGKMRTSKKQSDSYNAQSVMLFLSSRTNEMSQESRYQNSLFTIFLERGLRGGADKNRDRIITAREIFDFVHDGVSKASKETQHPVMWGKFDNNMAIINW